MSLQHNGTRMGRYAGLSDKCRDNFSANVLTWGLSIMLR